MFSYNQYIKQNKAYIKQNREFTIENSIRKLIQFNFGELKSENIDQYRIFLKDLKIDKFFNMYAIKDRAYNTINVNLLQNYSKKDIDMIEALLKVYGCYSRF